jgi:circadian clock protein KaiC
MLVKLISTGVDGLDEVLGGGFPEKSLIVLAGNPGVGKTVFSAQFLYRGCVDYGDNGVYVSLAESRESFIENMRGFGFNFERLERRGKFRFLDLLTVKEPAVQTVLDMIVEEVGEAKARRLVLDSYSALAQSFKDPIEVRIVVQTILGRIIRMMGCTTLMVEEIPMGKSRIGFGVEEFVADGVLRLNTTEFEGYRLRELEVLKLRGVCLKEPKLVYTFENGFRVFKPFGPKVAENPTRFDAVPDPPGKYSTGSVSLDEALGGGLPKGSIMLVELDEKITAPMYQPIIGPVLANFLAHGRSAFVVPSSGVDAAAILYNHRRVYGGAEEDWLRLVKIIAGKSLATPKHLPNVIHVEGENWREDLSKVFEETDKLNAITGQPILSILGVEMLTTLYGEKQCFEILNLAAAEARMAGAVIVAIVKAGLRELAIKLSPIADIYLRLKRTHGCLLLYGVKPRTGLYAVEADTSKDYSIPKLTAML